MTVLQWALLIVGAVAVIAIWWISRRDGRALKKWEPSGSAAPTVKPASEQMDIFRGSSGQFDEFGVGRPRKRVAPNMPEASETRPLFPEVERKPRPAAAARAEPEFLKPAAKAAKSRKAVEEKIVTLLIAEREGTAIFGPKIHRALAQQGLQFGDRKIYHRQNNGAPVFSVASLIKPGHLDPDEQEGFSTPGLSVFLLLPGPGEPVAAVQDMIAVSQALAKSLNAEVFDAERQPFTAERARALLEDVQAWAQRNA